jgi:hypothetical protein
LNDLIGPEPYGPDSLITDVSALLMEHGFVVEIPAAGSHELRYHASSILAILLGPDVFVYDPASDA